MLIFNKMAFCLFIWDSLTSINLYKRVEPIVYLDLLVLLYPNLTHCQGAEPAIPICIPDASVANSYLILGFWWCKQKKERGRYCLVDTYTHSYIYPYACMCVCVWNDLPCGTGLIMVRTWMTLRPSKQYLSWLDDSHFLHISRWWGNHSPWFSCF